MAAKIIIDGYSEHIIVAVRGNVKAFRSMQRTLVEHPRLRHSQKPDVFYDVIESVSETPRLELFARKQRTGWDTWGNEVVSKKELVEALKQNTTHKGSH